MRSALALSRSIENTGDSRRIKAFQNFGSVWIYSYALVRNQHVNGFARRYNRVYPLDDGWYASPEQRRDHHRKAGAFSGVGMASDSPPYDAVRACQHVYIEVNVYLKRREDYEIELIDGGAPCLHSLRSSLRLSAGGNGCS